MLEVLTSFLNNRVVPAWAALTGTADEHAALSHQLAQLVVAANDADRNDMAAHIHTKALQTLAAATVQLAPFVDLGNVRRASGLVEQVAADLRDVAARYGAGAAEVANHGVDGALLRALQPAPDGVEVTVTVEVAVAEVDVDVAVQAFRIARQAARHAYHAGPGAVDVRVGCVDGRVRVDVVDAVGARQAEGPGDGDDLDEVVEVAVMAARAEALGGRFHRVDDGSQVRVVADLPARGSTSPGVDGRTGPHSVPPSVPDRLPTGARAVTFTVPSETELAELAAAADEHVASALRGRLR